MFDYLILDAMLKIHFDLTNLSQVQSNYFLLV